MHALCTDPRERLRHGNRGSASVGRGVRTEPNPTFCRLDTPSQRLTGWSHETLGRLPPPDFLSAPLPPDTRSAEESPPPRPPAGSSPSSWRSLLRYADTFPRAGTGTGARSERSVAGLLPGAAADAAGVSAGLPPTQAARRQTQAPPTRGVATELLFPFCCRFSRPASCHVCSCVCLRGGRLHGPRKWGQRSTWGV